MKPVGWPRYMIEKPLKMGGTSYYWNVPNRDIAAGFTLGREALGPDYGGAVERARILNAHLDAWRDGRGVAKIGEAQPGYATLGWLFDQYRRHHLFQKKVSERTKGGYERAMRAIEDVPTKLGYPAARLPLASITPAAVDKLYEKLLKGPRKIDRVTVAGYCIDVARRAWSVVQRKHRTVVPVGNPWMNVERLGRKKKVKPAADRAEAYALAYALKELGEPHLGAAALICFEWHLRPENVLAGAITWGDYSPPDHVLIRHKKNDAEVPLPCATRMVSFTLRSRSTLPTCQDWACRSSSPPANAARPGPTPWPMPSVAYAKPEHTPGSASTSLSTPADMAD
jgi:hypothetical protein